MTARSSSSPGCFLPLRLGHGGLARQLCQFITLPAASGTSHPSSRVDCRALQPARAGFAAIYHCTQLLPRGCGKCHSS